MNHDKYSYRLQHVTSLFAVCKLYTNHAERNEMKRMNWGKKRLAVILYVHEYGNKNGRRNG